MSEVEWACQVEFRAEPNTTIAQQLHDALNMFFESHDIDDWKCITGQVRDDG
jgi:hypothetical protein